MDGGAGKHTQKTKLILYIFSQRRKGGTEVKKAEKASIKVA